MAGALRKNEIWHCGRSTSEASLDADGPQQRDKTLFVNSKKQENSSFSCPFAIRLGWRARESKIDNYYARRIFRACDRGF
jgi:hypothetical protein